MVIIKKNSNSKMLEIDDQEYERVKEFKFLETVWTKDNAITTEIKQKKKKA